MFMDDDFTDDAMSGVASTIQKLEDLLLVTVPRDLMDDQVLSLRREVVKHIRLYNSLWVLLDFSQVDICDSYFGRFIQSMANMVRLTGARVIISGLQDAVIETMVELGMTLPDVRAVLDLDEALAMSRTNGKVDADTSETELAELSFLDSSTFDFFEV
ncbi:MAG: STAS domain-containing protein [Anaerolineae bacterium]|nr:STAS domain-containing protein [Anaerolineae bacterium]